MTASDIITRARLLTNDNAGPNYRVTDVEMILWINDGMRLIWDIRSDSRLAAAGTRITYADASASADTLCILDTFRGALADYVCYRVFTMGSGSGDNAARASAHMQSFTMHLMPQQN